MSGTYTRPSMLNRLVRDRKLSKIMPNHFRLNFNLIESFPIVNTNDAPNHLGHDDHVAEVGPHRLWLLTSWSLPFLSQHSIKPSLKLYTTITFTMINHQNISDLGFLWISFYTSSVSYTHLTLPTKRIV